GTDPGDFYCEHVYYVSQAQAAARGSSVLRNAAGERLVGFLHVPEDRFTAGLGGAYTEAARQRGTREVVGAALRGYTEDLAPGERAHAVRLGPHGGAARRRPGARPGERALGRARLRELPPAGRALHGRRAGRDLVHGRAPRRHGRPPRGPARRLPPRRRRAGR